MEYEALPLTTSMTVLHDRHAARDDLAMGGAAFGALATRWQTSGVCELVVTGDPIN